MRFNIFSNRFDKRFIFLAADPRLLPDNSSCPSSEFMLLSCPHLLPSPPLQAHPLLVSVYHTTPHPHPGGSREEIKAVRISLLLCH